MSNDGDDKGVDDDDYGRCDDIDAKADRMLSQY